MSTTDNDRFPIKVRWSGDIRSKFETRELESLRGTPEDKLSNFTHDEIDLVREVNARQKSQLVIENERELDLTLRLLRNFRNGIASPSGGAKWATRQKAESIDRVIEELENAQTDGGEDERISEVINEQEATEVGRWRRVDPDQDLAGADDEVLVQWQDRDDEIAVYVTRDDKDDGQQYNARAEAIVDDLPFSKTSISVFNDGLESTLDDAIQWMRRHRPGVPFPTFSMRIEGGIFKPLMDIVRRLGGGNVLIEVRDDSVVFESSSAFNHIEFRIPAADMDSFDVEQEGELMAKVDPIWDALKPVNFSDVVPMAIDASEDRPRFQVAAQSSLVKDAVEFNRRSIPDPHPFDARFTVPGLEYDRVMNAARLIDAESGVFGSRDGVAFIRIEDETTGDEFTARIDTTEIEGEQVVTINPGFLQDLRRAVPRPSQTPLTFTLKGNEPVLAEYTVGDTDVDVRIALRTGAVPREVELPPEEITIPEEAETAEEPDEPMPEAPDEPDAIDQFAEQAAAEAQDVGDAVPDDIDVVVRVVEDELGRNRFEAQPSDPDIDALNRIIPPSRIGRTVDDIRKRWKARQFDIGDVVAHITVAGGGVRSVDTTPGENILESEEDRQPPPPEDEPDEERTEIIVTLVGGTPNYVVAGSPPGAVEDEAIGAARDTLGPPGQFDTDDVVGHVAYRGTEVTGITFNAGRSLLAERDEADDEPTEPSEPTDAGVQAQFSRGDIATIVEGSTLGVEVSVQIIGSELRELRLSIVDDPPVFFMTGSSTITVSAEGTEIETILAAIDRWEEFVDPGSMSPDQREELNEAREALSDQFSIDIPLLAFEVPPPEEDEPALSRFSEEDLTEILDRSTAGVEAEVRINEDANSLRIRLIQPADSTVEFRDEPSEVQGVATDPIPAVNEALAEWEGSVRLPSLDRNDVVRQRERVENEFDVDLLEVGDEPPEETVEEGERPEIELEGDWADIRDIALDQSIPKEDREIRIGERLEDRLFDAYPDEFTDIVVGIVFPQRQSGEDLIDVVDLKIGGSLSSAGHDRFTLPRLAPVIAGIDGVRDPKAVWDRFMELLEIFDPESGEFDELSRKLEMIDQTTAFRIEEGLVEEWDDIFLDPSEARQIVSRNPELWEHAILASMKDESSAWWAAQRVIECAEGASVVCDFIERAIAGENARGAADWYLQHAYQIFLEGEFDAERFVRDWHDVFKPGETEAEALERRGPVDLETLGRPGAAPDAEPEPEPEPEPAPEPEPEPEPEPAPEPTDETTVVSLNRPLTRSARRDLEEFGIIDTREINEPPRWTEVDLERRPPESVLDQHELQVAEDPIEVWEAPGGERVEIFSDRVLTGGTESGLDPQTAASEAREQGFTPIDVPDDSPLEPEEGEPEAEPEPAETVTIVVTDRDGVGYRATDDVPEAVQAAIEEAAADVLGPSWRFAEGDVVGEVTIRGTEVEAVDLSEGRRILELVGSDQAETATDERGLQEFTAEIRDRMG